LQAESRAPLPLQQLLKQAVPENIFTKFGKILDICKRM
jgi:hypothetical protein